MRGELALASAATLMSTVSIFVRAIEGDALSIAFLRMFSASLFLAAFAFATGRVPKLSATLLALGAFNIATVSCYIAAIQGLEVATAVLLLYMAPIYVLPLSLLIGERIGRKSVAAIPLGIVGLYLMLSPYTEVTPSLILGLLSGICYAFVFILSKSARKRHDPLDLAIFNTAFGAIVLLPYYATHPASVSIAALLGIGLIPTALPFMLFAYGIKYVEAHRAPVISLIEPLSATLIGYAYFGEVLQPPQLAGAAMILTSVAIAWRD